MARALALACALSIAVAVQVVVSPHSDECFYEQVSQSNKLSGSFEVISGGSLDVDTIVVGPNGESHYSVMRQKQGYFTVIAPSTGLYRVCFSNRMSSVSEKLVAFSIHTGDDLFQDIAKQEHITPLETEITQLSDAVASVEDAQKYVWARERASRDTNESTNSRVLWFSVLEAAVLVGMGLWQVYQLRTFFEKKRRF